MPLLSLESLIRIIAIVFYSGIAYYFFLKYKKEEISISLYWMGTFISWAFGSLIAIGVYLSTDDNLIASDYFALFVAIGVGIIASSTIEFEIININRYIWYIFVGAITLIGSILTFNLEPTLFIINKIALLTLVSLVPVPYLYLAYQGRDLRLSIVTMALFLHMPVTFIFLEFNPDPFIHQVLMLALDFMLALGLLAFKKKQSFIATYPQSLKNITRKYWNYPYSKNANMRFGI